MTEKPKSKKLDLKEVEITRIEQSGIGDRVCIDTASELKKGEGILVGSLSRALFLIHSESIESPYVNPRPFRVNAGPVSAYTLVPGKKTKYLIELSGGDNALAVDNNGNTREISVVRSKIESRPLLFIEANYGEISFHTFLQNAETIRLVDAKGGPLSVANLKVGDRVLAFVEEGKKGRHFGMSVEETIIEK